MQLDRIHVVLVRPRSAANVGMVARAIANHGLGGLVLVDPPAFDPDEARWRGPGAAQVIDAARIVATVDEAVAEARLVVGTTARRRRWEWPVWSPAMLAQAAREQQGPLCLLFGPEDRGLANPELEACHALLTLPTGPASSLNLAQAVTVTAHGLRAELGRDLPDPPPPARPPAPAGLLRTLSLRAEEVLHLGGYLRGRSPDQVRGTLFRLLARLSPDQAEASMLSGMLQHVHWTMTHPGSPEQEGP